MKNLLKSLLLFSVLSMCMGNVYAQDSSDVSDSPQVETPPVVDPPSDPPADAAVDWKDVALNGVFSIVSLILGAWGGKKVFADKVQKKYSQVGSLLDTLLDATRNGNPSLETVNRVRTQWNELKE